RYLHALRRAVVATRPPGGEARLVHLIETGYDLHGPDAWPDLGWCLQVLAAAYPDAALPHLDPALDSCHAYLRALGVEAAAALPPSAAARRLARASLDPVPYVAALARERWREPVHGALPRDELAGLRRDLLAGPPSKVLRARLLVVRGDSDDAREAMA